MNQPVLIIGMGCVSGLGNGVDANWRRLREGTGAIRPISTGAMTGVAAPIDCAVDLRWPEPDRLRRLGRLDPLSLYALVAAGEAVEQAGLAGHAVLANRTAILIGSGSGGNATIDTAYERLFARGQAKVHPQTIPSSMIAAPAAHISMAMGIHGPAFTLSSACASSAHAIGEAMHMIRSGRVDVAIAGGSEACLALGSWTAWNSLGVLAPDTCRPFSLGRKGMVLGEGAAMIVLESERHARARGAPVLGVLRGYGASSDAAHMTAPDPEGMLAAIRMAHEDSGIAPDGSAQGAGPGPVLISTHGTGTSLNDSAEAVALHAAYGASLAGHCVIATKSAHGHMIGAGGAMELVAGIKALHDRAAPPVLGYLGPDPACDLPLALAPGKFDGDVLVSNSFAFGGMNAVLIATRA